MASGQGRDCSASFRDEESFVQDNLDYFTRFFSRLVIREMSLPGKCQDTLRQFKNSWAPFFQISQVTPKNNSARVKKRRDFGTQCVSSNVMESGNFVLRDNVRFRPQRSGAQPEAQEPHGKKSGYRAPRNGQKSKDSGLHRLSHSGKSDCEFCQRAGHESRECRVLLDQCFICGSGTHFLRECPNYRRPRAKACQDRQMLQKARSRGLSRRVDTVAENLGLLCSNEDLVGDGRIPNSIVFSLFNACASDRGCTDVAVKMNDGGNEPDACDLFDKACGDGSVSTCMHDGDMVKEFRELRAKCHLYATLQDNKADVFPDRPNQSSCERNALDWSFEQDVEEMVNEKRLETVKHGVSTAIGQNVPRGQVNVSNSISMVVETEGLTNGMDSRSKDNFVRWLEQEMSAQEDLLSRAVTVSGRFNYSFLENMSDLLEMGGDAGDSVEEIMRKNSLKAATDHLKYVRESIRDYKEGVSEPLCRKYAGEIVQGA